MIQEKTFYSLQDISIMPACVTEINHRIECNPYNEDNKLPIFVAPMSSVIDLDNAKVFTFNKLNVIIPRTINLEDRLNVCEEYFIAVGLNEFENTILTLNLENRKPIKICVDIANGHMKKLIDLCRYAKNRFGNKMIIMAGNVANPLTYYDYAYAGIDYIRLSIGSGNACTTAANAAIYTPMASLIDECISIRKNVERDKYNYKSTPKIIADGGFNNYDDIIKALALGADYVMCGKIFAQCEEACGEILQKFLYSDGNYEYLNYYDAIKAKAYIERANYFLNSSMLKQSAKTSANQTIKPYPIQALNGKYRKYYGMSTKKAQKEMGKEDLHTSEGVERMVTVDYSLLGWIENFIDYLRSAMSYCNATTLDAFKTAKIIKITNSARNSYFK